MRRKFTFVLFLVIVASIGVGLLVGSRFPVLRRGQSFASSSSPALGSAATRPFHPVRYRESALAHKLLDGLRGLEIGGGAHNPFGLKTLNVDYTEDCTTVFKKHEIELCGEYMKVDIVASGDDLPFKDETVDFVVSSHVLEHFYDPVKAIQEWLRVVKPGGYVFMIVPHKDRTSDRSKMRTRLSEIIDRHDHPHPPAVDLHGHYSFWITQDVVNICKHYGWNIVVVEDVDDKVGNGFTVVLQKPGKLVR
jgi:predicted SAM-dependent methyltransferase